MTKILNKHKNTRLVIPEMPPNQEEQQKDFAQEHVNENQSDQDTLPVFIEVWGNQVPPVHCPSYQQSTTDDEKENSSSGMATCSDYVLAGCETKCSDSSSVEVRNYCIFLFKNIFTVRKRSLGQSNIFTVSVCLSGVCMVGGCAWWGHV